MVAPVAVVRAHGAVAAGIHRAAVLLVVVVVPSAVVVAVVTALQALCIVRPRLLLHALHLRDRFAVRIVPVFIDLISVQTDVLQYVLQVVHLRETDCDLWGVLCKKRAFSGIPVV